MPFYIFSHESRFEEYNKNTASLKTLITEYEEIRNRLEELLVTKVMNEYTKCTIVDMLNRVLEHIARKYENVRKGVKSVMGGQILEYEAKTIRKEGLREGRLEILFDLVNDNLLSIKDAAFRAKLTEEDFREKMEDYGK